MYKVNVYTYKTDELPICYKGTLISHSFILEENFNANENRISPTAKD